MILGGQFRRHGPQAQVPALRSLARQRLRQLNDVRSAADALNANLAEIARRRYAIEAVRGTRSERSRELESASGAQEEPDGSRSAPSSIEQLAGRIDLKIAWDDSLPEPFRLREEAVLRADLAQLSDALTALDKQMGVIAESSQILR